MFYLRFTQKPIKDLHFKHWMSVRNKWNDDNIWRRSEDKTADLEPYVNPIRTQDRLLEVRYVRLCSLVLERELRYVDEHKYVEDLSTTSKTTMQSRNVVVEQLRSQTCNTIHENRSSFKTGTVDLTSTGDDQLTVSEYTRTADTLLWSQQKIRKSPSRMSSASS